MNRYLHFLLCILSFSLYSCTEQGQEVDIPTPQMTFEDQWNVDYNTVTFTCTVMGNVSVGRLIIEYSTDETLASAQRASFNTISYDRNSALVEGMIEGLQPQMTYYYRYTVENKISTYVDQKIRSFNTLYLLEAVDLGLSVKWASYNVGASRPEEYGTYYAWGETEAKSDFSWPKYKWCNGSEYTLTKYNTNSSYGTVDNKTVLESSDDVAHVKLGGKWRIPTDAEWEELCTKCTWTWTTLNGVYGRRVTGPNGNSIFLPAAGFRFDWNLGSVGFDGYYWSSSKSKYSERAWIAYFYSDDVSRDSCFRCLGFSVRPVSE